MKFTSPVSILLRLTVLLLVMGGPNWSAAQSRTCEQVISTALGPDTTKKVDFLVEAFGDGGRSYDRADGVARTIIGKGPSAQTAWLKAVGTAYRLIPKKHANPMKWTPVSPRRMLDRVFMQTRKLHEDFRAGKVAGVPAITTYSEFLNEQNKFFHGNYGVKEVLAVIQFVQRELATLPAQNGPPVEVFLGGSFVNGKANLAISDVDFSMTDSLVIAQSATWSERLGAMMTQLRPESRLTAEVHSIGPAFYGTLNPVVVRVTAESAEIWVFPPARISFSGPELKPSIPDRYPL